ARRASTRVEGVLDPGDARARRVDAVDRDDVEAQGLAAPGALPEEQMAGRLHESAPLARPDALDGGRERGSGARPDLDDHARVVVPADEVALAELAAVVAREDRKAVPLVIASGHV